MPQGDRTSITVKEDTFEMLSERKPGGVTWDYYLQNLVGGSEVPTDFLNLLSEFFDGKAEAKQIVEDIDWLTERERERWFDYVDLRYNLERPNKPA